MTSFLLAATALVFSPQDLSQTVSLDIPAARASVVMAKLSQQLRIPLETTPQTENEVLLIKVKDKPLRDVMAKIAEVAEADWKASGNGYVLSRSSERQNLALRTEREHRAAVDQAAIDRAVEAQAKLDPWSEKEAARLAKEDKDLLDSIMAKGTVQRRDVARLNSTPGGRVLVELVARLGSAKTALIGDGERAVFALRPNAMQTVLPANSDRLLEAYVANQLQYAEAAKRLQNDDGNRQVVMVNGSSGSRMGDGDPSLGIGQALLIASRQNGLLNFNLLVADRKGGTLASAVLNLPPASPSLSEPDRSATGIPTSEIAKEWLKNSASPAGGTMIRSGNIAVSASRGTGETSFTFGNNYPNPNTPISPELKQWLLQPEANEPLSLFVGPALAFVAQTRSEDLVACLPDGTLNVSGTELAEGKVSVERYLAELRRTGNADVKEAEGWMTVTPIYGPSSRANRINRAALGKLLRAANAQQVLRLDDMTAFALAQYKPFATNDYDGRSLGLICRAAEGQFRNVATDTDLLRLLGSLTPRQRTVLDSGQNLRIADLSAAQKGYLHHQIYQTSGGPIYREPNSAGTPRFIGRGVFGTVKNEATLLCPNGVPATGLLGIRTESVSAAFAQDSKRGIATTLTPTELASNLYSKERPDMGFLGDSPTFDQFISAERRTYTLTLELGDSVGLDRVFQDNSFNPSARKGPLSSLPESFRTKTDETLTAMKKALDSAQFGTASPTRGNIPPVRP